MEECQIYIYYVGVIIELILVYGIVHRAKKNKNNDKKYVIKILRIS